jgi:glycerol-3-phosphate responsive antiterminator
MTLSRFVAKNAFRNKRRSILTVLSIMFSLLLLTLMITIWRAFYVDNGSAESSQRLVVRHKVSLTFALPGFYREKIRLLVRWRLQGQQAGEFLRPVRHRSRGIL